MGGDRLEAAACLGVAGALLRVVSGGWGVPGALVGDHMCRGSAGFVGAWAGRALVCTGTAAAAAVACTGTAAAASV